MEKKFIVQADAEAVVTHSTLDEAIAELENWINEEIPTDHFDRVVDEKGNVLAYCEGGRVVKGSY